MTAVSINNKETIPFVSFSLWMGVSFFPCMWFKTASTWSHCNPWSLIVHPFELQGIFHSLSIFGRSPLEDKSSPRKIMRGGIAVTFVQIHSIAETHSCWQWRVSHLFSQWKTRFHPYGTCFPAKFDTAEPSLYTRQPFIYRLWCRTVDPNSIYWLSLY